jgi:hypothetical protein
MASTTALLAVPDYGNLYLLSEEEGRLIKHRKKNNSRVSGLLLLGSHQWWAN